MSAGRVEDEAAASGEGDFAARLADRLQPGEEARLSWDAKSVRWANQWGIDSETPTAFAATDRRVVFETTNGTTSIGYDHVRAVKVDHKNEGPDLSMAFLGCGAICLLVGLLVLARDFANGAGLVVLSLALLVSGVAMGQRDDTTTVTLVIDNERQRLSFSAPESVGQELSELVNE